MVNLDRIKSLYSEATDYKKDILSDYNSVFEFVDSTFSIKDNGSKESISRRATYPVITESVSFMVNYLMSSLFSRTSVWAMLQITPSIYQELTNTDAATAENTIKDINSKMETNSISVWEYNNNSNYYAETAKALRDCATVGTGIRKIIELNSMTKPFTYEYQSLDNIYFLEDSFGQPNIIFKEHVELTLEKYQDIFGGIFKGLKIPDEFENEDSKINLLEIIIPQFNEDKGITTYNRIVTNKSMDVVYNEIELEYNPYTIFRWSTTSSSPLGKGIGYDNLGKFQEYQEFKELRKIHAQSIVTPPFGWRGSVDLMYKASLNPGARNWLGDGITKDNNLGLEILNKGTSLIPLDQDIAACEADIRNMFMSQPLGEVHDTKNRTATEVSLRHEMFRKKFSGTYELLNTELLEPTFMAAYSILKNKNLLSLPEDESAKATLNHGNITYINALTLSAGLEEVNNTVSWYYTVMSVVGEQNKDVLLNVAAFIKWSSVKAKIPLDLVMSQSEIQSNLDNKQKLMQLQQLSGIQGQGVDVSGMIKEAGGDVANG